jgi:WD40 repeat protein
MPLEPLIFRALNAQGIDGRHERLVYTWEIAIQIAAASTWALCRQRKVTSTALDEVLPKLARPMFGHWLELLRAGRALLAKNPGPLAPLLEGLEKKRDDRLEALAERIRVLPKRNAKLGGGTVGALLDALPVYRNETRGHGEPDTEFRTDSVEPLLEGLIAFCELAPPVGDFRPVIVDKLETTDDRKSVHLAWMDGAQVLLETRPIESELQPARPYLFAEPNDYVPLFPIAAASRGADGWVLGWLKQQVRVPTLSFESSVGGAFSAAIPDDEYSAFLHLAPDSVRAEVEAAEGDPWRGLLAYEEEHANLFHGRDAITIEILSRLENRGAAILCGASGSGKSSLVRAGILPKLRERQKHMLREVIVLTMVPGARPMHALREAFRLATADRDPASVARWSREVEEAPLIHLVRGLAAGGKHVTLFVDQLEEVATLCSDPAERTTFLDAITSLATALDPNEAFVITTVRADRIQGLLEHAGLRAMLQRSLEPIGTLKRDELRDVITLPLKGRRVSIDPALTERILADVGDEPGALALVSQLLTVLWEMRGKFGNALTIAGYESVGGVSGVLGKRSDEARAEAGDGVDRVLVRLARRAEDGTFTRRRMTIGALTDALGMRRSELDACLTPFVSRRLIVLGEEEVEVAHEALLRSWPHLKELLEREAAAIALRQEVERAAEAGELWTDATSKLKRAEELVASGQMMLGERERVFLESSRRGVVRAKRLRQGVVAAIAVLAVLAIGLAYRAKIASAQAMDEKKKAVVTSRDAFVSEAMALAVSPESRKDAPFAALRALAVDKELGLVPGPRERVALTTAAMAARRFAENVVLESDLTLHDGTFSPDGKRVAIVGDDRLLRIFDATTGGSIAAEPLGDAGSQVRWTPDGACIVIVTALAVEARTGDGKTLIGKLAEPELNVLALSDDASSLVATSAAADATLYTLDRKKGFVKGAALGRGSFLLGPGPSGRPIARSDGAHVQIVDGRALQGEPPLLRGAAFSRDGKLLAAHAGKTVRVWDAVTGAIASELPAEPNGFEVAFADEHRLVHLAPNALEIWDDDRTKRECDLGAFTAIKMGIGGSNIAVSTDDGAVRVIDRSNCRVVNELDGHSDALSALRFSPDGQRVLTTSYDRTATIWNLEQPSLARVLPEVDFDPVSAEPTADRQIVLTSAQHLQIYDFLTGAAVATMSASTPLKRRESFAATTIGIAEDGSAYFWDTKTGRERAHVGGLATSSALTRLAHVPRALLCLEAKCVIVDDNAKTTATIEPPAGVVAVDFARDGKRVVIGGKDGGWTAWNETGQRTAALNGLHAAVPRAILAGDMVLVIGDGAAELHRADGGALVGKVDGDFSALAEDGSRVRMKLRDKDKVGWVRIYDTKTGAALGEYDASETDSHYLSPSGDLDVVFGLHHRGLVVVDTKTGSRVTSFEQHRDAVTLVQWSEDGRTLATAGLDRTIRVWTARTGEEIAVLHPDQSPSALALSADGSRLITMNMTDSRIRLWDVSWTGALTHACNLARKRPDFARVAPVCP